MAITNVKNYEQKPYHDDFNETKNYQRILFKPGFAVQARELTQLQTVLQAQIDKLGQYNFKDGDRVINGKISVNVEYNFIKLLNTHSGSALTNINEFVGLTITGATTGVTAVVLDAIAEETTDSGTDPITLYVKYTNSGTDEETQTFEADEVISTTLGSGATKSATIAAQSTTPIGAGSEASITEGVYFISGNFVHVAAESLILEKYSPLPSYIVGLKVEENIVSSSTSGYGDLVDNAQGTSNETAPGADRYVIATGLIKEPIDLSNRTTNSYVHLATLNSGIVIKKSEDPIDTVVSDRLETRTYEESGDYVLNPFLLDINEYLNDGSNSGFRTAAEIIVDGDGSDTTTATAFGDARFAIGVEPSTAYIEGRRIEKTEVETVILEKPRSDSDKFDMGEIIQSIGYDNYVVLNNVEGIPDITSFATANIKDAGGVIGTCRIRDLHETGTEIRCHIFDVTMSSGENFSTATTIEQGSNFIGTFAATGQRVNAGDTSLVFPLPARAVATLQVDNAGSDEDSLDTEFRVKVSGAVDANGDVTISLPGALASINDVMIHTGTTAGSLATIDGGQYVVTSSVGSSNNQIIFDGLPAAYQSATINVICTVKKTNVQRKVKQYVSSATKVFTGATATSEYSLDKHDIVELISVVENTSGNDVTEDFILDDGQRDSYYDIGKIILKGSATIANSVQYTATFSHYNHQSGGDYFSVDSYPASGYSDIPAYKGVPLRDCLDFRPTKSTGGNFETTSQTSNGILFATGVIPSTGTAEVNVEHYMGRVDKLFLGKDGEYKIVKGISRRTPVEPENITDAVHLYTFFLNPYVFGLEDIIVSSEDHRRYTMRDIGQIEKRIKNLEYYTSLSLLEKSASDAQVLDGTGVERFKNGFLVDGFFGHNVADSAHPDYAAAIDKEEGILRPQFDERNINLIRNEAEQTSDGNDITLAQANSGNKVFISQNGGVATLPYTEVNEINQPYGSYAEFVNPYNVVVWDGTMELDPDSDEWKEVDQRPDIIINDNSQYDQFASMAKETGILGTVWNEWETNWTGKARSTSTTERLTLITKKHKDVRNGKRAHDNVERLTGTANTGGKWRAKVDRTTTVTTQEGTRSRSGVQTYIATDVQSKVVGNSLVETNFIPFMRSRKIFFKAELLKPNTRLYAFFNGVNVTSYCRNLNAGITWDNSHIYSWPRTRISWWRSRRGFKSYRGRLWHYYWLTLAQAQSHKLVTDASGKIYGSFMIPNNGSLKFKTGTRLFKLTDSSTNNDNLAKTQASQNYFAKGILETYQRTIINTKVPRLATRELNQAKTVTKKTTKVNHELIKYYDPIAETFTVTTKGGCFVTSLDLYFAAKDSAIPVNVSIREVENGYPTQRVLPGCDRNIYPSDINVDASGTSGTATNIKWDYPVHLKEGAEYAIVLISNSDVYRCWVAETSKVDKVTNKRITKQPYNGVFFTSANASTWTAEQNKDLKFKLNRASFNTNECTLTLENDDVDEAYLGQNAFEVISNPSGTTCKIRVHQDNHGMYGADDQHKVALTEIKLPDSVTEVIPGITASSIQYDDTSATTINNTTYQVKEAELDSYVIIVPGQAASTAIGRRFGVAGSRVHQNQMYDLVRLNTNTIEFPQSEITFSYRGYAGKSQDGQPGQRDNYNADPGYMDIIANTNQELLHPSVIASPINETFKGITGTAFVQAKFNTTVENLSPVMDMNRTSLFTIQNRVNDVPNNVSAYTTRGTYIADTSNNSTSSASKYITKTVDLDTDADVLDIYINANRPNYTAIDVYYKLTDDTDVEFDDLSWTLINPDSTIPFNDNDVFQDVRYQLPAAEQRPFNRFSVKIVMRSSQSTNVPKVKDFRAIATT